MKLQFKSRPYDFNVRKYFTGPEVHTRNSNIDDLIFGADTESADVADDKYEPICFQISGDNSPEILQYLKSDETALQSFLETFDLYYGGYVTDDKKKNCGCWLYFHNLEYDFLQLTKQYPQIIQMIKNTIGLTEDYELFNNGEFTATLKKNGLFRGNAPFFDIKIYHNRNVNYTIRFRDTYSYFPGALSTLGEELKLDECKLERPENIGAIDYRELSPDDIKRIEFELYAKVDAKVVRLVAERIRELHKAANLHKIRVSAPSFAISYLLHNLPENTLLVNGCNDESIMQLILDSYGGGRSGGIFHGALRHCFVLDYKSSYPASMTTLPSFNEKMVYFDYPIEVLKTLTTDDILEICNEYHCFMNIDGEETNAKYPSLIHSYNGKLYPVNGEFENISSSGVEVYAGIKSGDLHIHKINKLVVLIDEPDAFLPFKFFAESAYSDKQNAIKASIEYIAAKLRLNGAYGKLIETLKAAFVSEDDDFIVPYIPELEKDFANTYYSKHVEYLELFDPEVNNIKFIDFMSSTLKEILSSFPADKLEYTCMSNLSLTNRQFGRYAIPAAAALITATSRARLIVAIKLLGALYWDTDSVFCEGDYNEDELNIILLQSKNYLPQFIQSISIGENLGNMDAEVTNCFGYLAGTKRYLLENDVHSKCKERNCKKCKKETNDKFKSCVCKSAIHGMPSADKKYADELIQNLATGHNATYKGKARPLKAKEAKTADMIGKFTSKQYQSLFELDPRLKWTKSKNGWMGEVWDYHQIKTIDKF